MRLATALATAAALLLSGCGSSDQRQVREDAALEASSVCPGGTLAADVVVCTRLATGGILSLPADTGEVAYGALARGAGRLLTRDGTLDLEPSVAEELQRQVDALRSTTESAQGGAVEGGDIAARTGPYAQLVYRAQVSGRSVTSLAAAVRVDETALMTAALGGTVLEGAIAPLISDADGYDVDATLPVRLELARTAVDGAVRGRLVNATRPVRMTSGRCAPALSAAAEHDPLQGPFTERVELQRFPSMHAPFDDELLLKWSADVSNMGGELFPSAASVLGHAPEATRWVTTLHGNPTAGPALTLTVVQGGGGAC